MKKHQITQQLINERRCFFNDEDRILADMRLIFELKQSLDTKFHDGSTYVKNSCKEFLLKIFSYILPLPMVFAKLCDFYWIATQTHQFRM